MTLTVNGPSTATFTVLAACQVPDFHNVHVNDAQATWNASGFTTTVTISSGSGNYKINTQSISSGTLNPSGGCSGATITVGP